MWTLYKEVQRYWDRGLRAPDDVTVVFTDDNWGNLRKLPEPGDDAARRWVWHLLSLRLRRAARAITNGTIRARSPTFGSSCTWPTRVRRWTACGWSTSVT